MPSFTEIGQLVLGKKSFKGFYHIWAWWPYWSCDLDSIKTFLFLSTLRATYETYDYNQLLQLCTARTAWSKSDKTRLCGLHSCNSWWIALVWSVWKIKLVSVHFGKCTTLVVTKCWPMVIRQPCGHQWKAEKLGAFWHWPITRCLIKSDSS